MPDSDLKDEQVLFLSDVVPTAYWSVEHAGVKAGDTVIVLGCGPIGLMAQKFAKIKGAARVIAIDNVEHRLEHAKKYNGAEVYNFDKEKEIGKLLKEQTSGGADVVIDCVGFDGSQSSPEPKLSKNLNREEQLVQLLLLLNQFVNLVRFNLQEFMVLRLIISRLT